MKFRRKCLVAVLGALPLLASAQLLPPVVPRVDVPAPLQLPALPQPRVNLPATRLASLRGQVRDLLRRFPDRVERDPRGAPIVRAVIIALRPDAAALQRALAQGFLIQEDRNLPVLEQRVVTLLAPAGTSTADALRALRAADPVGQYDFDHLYVEQGASTAIAGAEVAGNAANPVAIRVGLIDGGVDATHPVFQHRPPQVSGCEGHPVPGAHGTAVASLFVGWSAQFSGAAPGAELLAVDVYCGSDAPGGRVRDIVAGLAELAEKNVRVINVSIVGPDNVVLAAVIRALVARPIAIVAASGNDGPNAAPLYPAAYPGVIAVSAVDARQRVLPEACGGGHISFAAPGADMLAATSAGGFATVRGTSYAAPLVAGLVARALAGHDDASVKGIVQQLAATAHDRGSKGRDRRYGYGLVGAELRVDPRSYMGRATQNK
ncbi:MAG: S8 family serine peptidase [Steroidobacteraceae bacterium]